MTVAELIAKLQKLPPDALAVQSKDAEGNGFSPVEEVEVGAYLAETTWAGEFYGAPRDSPAGSVAAVCLWPVN